MQGTPKNTNVAVVQQPDILSQIGHNTLSQGTQRLVPSHILVNVPSHLLLKRQAQITCP